MRRHVRLARAPRRSQRVGRDVLASLADETTSLLDPNNVLQPLTTTTQITGQLTPQANGIVSPVTTSAGAGGIAAGSSPATLPTGSETAFGALSMASSIPSSPVPASSTTDNTEFAPSTTQAPPTSDDPSWNQPNATPSTSVPAQTTVETSTAVIPVTSVISVSGTAAATTVWVTPLASADAASASGDRSGAAHHGANITEIVAIGVACVCVLVLSVFGYFLWRKRKRAARDEETPVAFTGEYQFSPIEDPFKFRALDSPMSPHRGKGGAASLLPIQPAPQEEYKQTHPEEPVTIPSRPSSTYSYINSLCPETSAIHFPEPPPTAATHSATHSAPSSRPQTPTTPGSYASASTRSRGQGQVVGFRPLPMPIALSPLAAAHFASPEERASVWSVMEVEDARGTIYDYAWNGDEVLEIGSPPEYTRE